LIYKIFEGGDDVNKYEANCEVLIKLFNEVIDMKEKTVITDAFKDISNNDMRIIEVIGMNVQKNMSTVARALSITVGTLTIAINNLVKKGYVERVRSEEDRRVVLISLSEKGREAYRHYEGFHDEMMTATLKGLDEGDAGVLVKALTNLKEFFGTYHE